MRFSIQYLLLHFILPSYNQVANLLERVKEQENIIQSDSGGRKTLRWAPIATALHRSAVSCQTRLDNERKKLQQTSVLDRLIKQPIVVQWTEEMVFNELSSTCSCDWAMVTILRFVTGKPLNWSQTEVWPIKRYSRLESHSCVCGAGCKCSGV